MCRYYEIDEDTIWQQTRGKGVISPARSVAMYMCQRAAGMKLAEIAEAFGLVSYASARATIRLVKAKNVRDKSLEESIYYILLDLTPLIYDPFDLIFLYASKNSIRMFVNIVC